MSEPVHVHERRVAHGDTDADGVVHFSRYLIYCEDALFDWFRRLGLDLGLPEAERTIAITNVQMSYRKPLRFGQSCEVAVAVAGRRRFSLRLEMSVRARGEVCAEGWLDAAILERRDWRLADLPAPLTAETAEPVTAGGGA